MAKKDFRPAILRALARRPQSKRQLVDYLGAQDAWDAVDYRLRQLRVAGFVAYRYILYQKRKAWKRI